MLNLVLNQQSGKLKNKLLLFGGVYSNLQALQELRKQAELMAFLPEEIICTGDIVAYCAQPNECIQLIKDWGIQVISGNVEQQLVSGQDDCACDFDEGSRCDLFSKNWYPFVQKKLSQESMNWLKGIPDFLKFEFGNKTVAVVHGAKSQVSKFIFKSTHWSVKQSEFDLCGSDIIIAGHCGLPFLEHQKEKLWLNPGVIGMPANDGTNRVWFASLHLENEQIKAAHHSFEYDSQTAARLMHENNLPVAYAKTLSTGLWDNCEILPEEETRAQGETISLKPLLF